MELRDLLPGIIGSFVGVMGWLLVGLWHAINLYRLQDGRIVHSRSFFAPDFDAPDCRAPYREAP